ncbi:hypothetical protein B9Z65_4880 [Elsinoe australis]|uniref:polynucleotide adenylyltransferase n=1 Tax=Elsinoe australis TaxID=40998 RepID=A0A2P8A6A7_9PEZI|nr:hypothetical protein B9Z65_4880 [Elsinoe australis]
MSYAQRRRPPSPRRDGHEMHRFGGNAPRDFDFRAPNGGSAPSFPSTSGHRRPGRAHDRDGGRGRNTNRGRFRGGWKKFAASDREIFRARRSPTPEQMAGMNNADSRFRVLEDLPSDDESDDAGFVQLDGAADAENGTEPTPATAEDSDDMEMSSEDEHPRAKRARTTVVTNDAEESKPKWSNPDPYTSLPPPGSENAGPKKDVVAMIRKAKVENADRSAEAAQAAEFISLNFDDDGNENEEGERPSSPDQDTRSLQGRAPNGPRSYDSSRRYDERDPAPVSTDRWPPPPPPHRAYDHYQSDMRGRGPSPPRGYDQYHPPPRPDYRDGDHYSSRDQYDRYDPFDRRADYPRGHDFDRAAPVPPQYDEDEYAPPPAMSNGYHSPPSVRDVGAGKRKRYDRSTDVAPGYLPSALGDPTPWMAYCDDRISNTGEWLHDELRSFRDYVTPRAFESKMREDLVRRIDEAFKLKFSHVEVKAFGSFATNMYLPVSDLDLVAMSSTYRFSGFAEIAQTPRDLRQIAKNIIQKSGLSRNPNCIIGAKVPIIKFTDIRTQIDVDVSFENDSGLRAIPTLAQWTEDYPSLPYLVYPIKHFLASRTFNDVSIGGLGGFSIICLIVHRLDELQARHTTQWIQKNLDFALMDFFDFYGNKFDYRTMGLDMRTMRLIPKTRWRGDRLPQLGRVLIVDPNNPRNDISGGTGKIVEIFRAFSHAHDELRRQMSIANTLRRDTGQRTSIMRCLLSGFDKYQEQRNRLQRLYEEDYGSDGESSVQFVSAQPVGPGRSRNDAIDLTAVDTRPAAISLDGQSDKKSRKQRRTERHQQEGHPSGQHTFFGDNRQKGQSDFQAMNDYLASFDAGQQAQSTSAQNVPPPPPPPVAAEAKKERKKKRNKEKEKAKKASSKAPQEQKAKVQKQTAPKGPKVALGPADAKKLSNKVRAAKTQAVQQAAETTAQEQSGKKNKTGQEKKMASVALAERSRATEFKKRFPGASCPDQMSKQQFKDMVSKQAATAS